MPKPQNRASGLRILVTGGGGYIGSIAVMRFLEYGHDVHVIDDFRYGENSLALSFNDPNLRVSVGDVRDAALMRDAVKSAGAPGAPQ